MTLPHPSIAVSTLASDAEELGSVSGGGSPCARHWRAMGFGRLHGFYLTRPTIRQTSWHQAPALEVLSRA